MPMPSGRKIRPPVQAPLTTLPSNLTVCGHAGHVRQSQFSGSSRASAVTAPPQTQPAITTVDPQASQPPLITDTLTACLDVNGTYICTPYSPRCYIIQKVTPTSLRVSPSSGMLPGSSSNTSPSSRPSSLSPSVGTKTGADQKSPERPYLPSGHRVDAGRGSTTQLSADSGGATNPALRQPSPRSTGGSNYMNCEVGRVTGKSSGQPPIGSKEEVGATSMGVATQLQYTINSAAYGNDTRSLNGVHDTRDETMNVVEETRISESGDVLDSQPGMNNNQVSNDTDATKHELRQTVMAQLEYYFSPDNLSTDKFLVSQMDSDQYVYISTIANFNMIKKLSSDLDLITNVLRESKHVQVHSDGKRVRPVSNRTVVIVRGIPDTTTVDEIKALFEKENAPRCNHCEFAFNDSWYLSFDSDAEAMRAHRYLREEVREFKGQPIMARIKSRPTTLLGPGMGMNPVKNGFHPPSVSLPTYIAAAPFVPVPVSQPGISSNVTTTPIYATPQQVSSAVFTLPPAPYAAYSAQLPWASFYDLNSSLTPVYGLPSQSHGFQKPTMHQMVPRHRTSKSESESFNGPPQPRGPRRTNTNGNTGDSAMINGAHVYNNQQRKSSAHGHSSTHSHAPPAPLLAMAPQAQLTNHISSHPHSHNHHANSGQATSMNNNASSNSHIGRNGHLHYSSLPPQSLPHGQLDSYHRPPYRIGETRPRSSLGSRRTGPPRSRDEEGNHDGTNSQQASIRRYPSSRGGSISDPPLSSSPQPSAQVTGTNYSAQATGSNKFDLEVSSFPPLPGSANSGRRNGDSPYEGRLSDVVKGVKSLKVTTASSTDKEEPLDSGFVEARAGGSPSSSTEIVVSAGDDSPSSTATYVVSAASPTPEVEEGLYRERGTDPLSPTSHVSATVSASSASAVASSLGSKKEFREVGVGGAGDTQDIAQNSKELFVSGTRVKETADKSTQSVIVKTTSTSTVPTPTHSKPMGGSENSKKSARPEDDSGLEKKEPSALAAIDSAKRCISESCSTEDLGGGPVRLSYAQAAQRIAAANASGADKPPVSSTTVSPPLPSEDLKKQDSGGGRGGPGGKEGQRLTNKAGAGTGPQRSGGGGFKRPPSGPRRDRVFSNGSTNRMGSNNSGGGGSGSSVRGGEHKN